MLRLFSIISVSFWVISGAPPTFAACVKPWIPPEQRIKDLYAEVSLIGPDDRQIRTERDEFTSSVESSQGRIWCLSAGAKAPQKTPTKQQLRSGFALENATLFIDKDIILTNRHLFETEKGPTGHKPQKCWFEHLSTGQIIPVTADMAHPPLSGPDATAGAIQDIAVLRLERPVQTANPLAQSDLLINGLPEPGKPLKVISNYAQNYAPKEALTMTNCQIRTPILYQDKLAPIIGTDCDTGKGSSGAQVYAQDGDRPKLYGLVTGQVERAAPGSGYELNKNSTLVTTFDDSLMETYRKVRASAPPPST